MDDEDRFRAACHKHGDQLSDMLADLIEYSERTGVPVGWYTPRSLEEKFGDIDFDVILECAPVTEGYEDG